MKYYMTLDDYIYSENELKTEFQEMVKYHETECTTFEEYINECTGKNGTLLEMDSKWYKNIENHSIHELDWDYSHCYSTDTDENGNFVIYFYSNYEDMRNCLNPISKFNYELTLSNNVKDSHSCRVLIDDIYYYFG